MSNDRVLWFESPDFELFRTRVLLSNPWELYFTQPVLVRKRYLHVFFTWEVIEQD